MPICSRRLVALLCLAVICIVALSHGTALPLFALLAPLWLFFGLAATLTVIGDESAALPAAPIRSSAGSRAPPCI